MKVFKYMWFSESLDSVRKDIYESLTSQKVLKNEYVIVLPEFTHNVLDIIPAKELKQKYYKESDRMIIGVAGSMDEARELAGGIIGMVYQANGNTDISAYVEQAEKGKLWEQ